MFCFGDVEDYAYLYERLGALVICWSFVSRHSKQQVVVCPLGRVAPCCVCNIFGYPESPASP